VPQTAVPRIGELTSDQRRVVQSLLAGAAAAATAKTTPNMKMDPAALATPAAERKAIHG
jgi:hypothetical protein